MGKAYYRHIAFIFEGDTEKVFYFSLIDRLCEAHPGYELNRQSSAENGVFYTLSNGDRETIIMYNVVGTITQLTNSNIWFEKSCSNCYKPQKWDVFLCYDTDSYKSDVTKFYKGDWQELRKNLAKCNVGSITDLAAAADIEDTMLLDENGVFSFLNIPPTTLPTGKKGKSKMKALFRLKGQGSSYHSGDRAKALIDSLDFRVIIDKSPMNLRKIEQICFED